MQINRVGVLFCARDCAKSIFFFRNSKRCSLEWTLRKSSSCVSLHFVVIAHDFSSPDFLSGRGQTKTNLVVSHYINWSKPKECQKPKRHLAVFESQKGPKNHLRSASLRPDPGFGSRAGRRMLFPRRSKVRSITSRPRLRSTCERGRESEERGDPSNWWVPLREPKPGFIATFPT